MNAREIVENAVKKAMDENLIGYDDWYPEVIAASVLAALEDLRQRQHRLDPAVEKIMFDNIEDMYEP